MTIAKQDYELEASALALCFPGVTNFASLPPFNKTLLAKFIVR